MEFGLPCPTHRLQDLWGLSTDFLGRQGSRNTQSDHRGNDSENQVGHYTHPGPRPPHIGTGKHWKGLDVAEPKHWVLQETAEAVRALLTPESLGGAGGVVGHA